MGLFSLLHTSRDALAAQARGLETVGQNVANVNTPGYARREVVLEARPYGPGAHGGVQAVDIKRVADRYLEQSYFDHTGLSAAADERNRWLARVDAAFDESSSQRIGGALNHMFSAFSTLATRPNDLTARAEVLRAAEAFAAETRSSADNIATLRTELAAQASEVTGEVNDLASRIAKLNQQIEAAENAGASAADLKDQRTDLIEQLSGRVDTRVVLSDSGRMTIMAAGATLVDGDQARSLSIDIDGSGNLKLLAARSGGPPTDATGALTGGTLAGIFQTRDQDLSDLARQLDDFAFDVASAVNTQHASGVGLDGTGGRNLFELTLGPTGAARALALHSDMVGQPERLAAASNASSLPGGSGNAVALSQLSSSRVATGLTRTPAEALSALVGQVGLLKAGAETSFQAQSAMKALAYELKESVSGVSLDEEMVSLTKFQRAYEASAKVLQTVDNLLEELLARLGR